MLPENILLSTNAATDVKKFLEKKRYSKVGVLVDENTKRDCYPTLREGLPEHFLIEVKSGEEHKTLETCQDIWQAMTDEALDRNAVLIVLGGGVLGDMGGFCAATYKRGIDFILVATTLLAQVDASIGGKLAVDFNHFKNHIGVFQLPVLTLLYKGFFKSLAPAELRSGYAEVIKHILISDAQRWDVIKEKGLADQDWDDLITHSVSFKAYVVTEDPKEKGLRKILNAGHTIGHAVESYLLARGNRVLHGEAIAAGLIAENYLAVKRGLLSQKALDEITSYIKKIYGKINLKEDWFSAIAELTLQDKKNSGNRILCVLLDGIGRAKPDCEITLPEVKEALAYYQSC